MDIKVTLTAGERAIFEAMRFEPYLRIQEDQLGGDCLRYGLVRLNNYGHPLCWQIINSEDVFGLMALGLLEFTMDNGGNAIFTSSIYWLSEKAKAVILI